MTHVCLSISLTFRIKSKFQPYRSETCRVSLFLGYLNRANDMVIKRICYVSLRLVENGPKVTNKLVRFVDCAIFWVLLVLLSINSSRSVLCGINIYIIIRVRSALVASCVLLLRLPVGRGGVLNSPRFCFFFRCQKSAQRS